MNAGAEAFRVSAAAPNLLDISTHSTTSLSACKLFNKHCEGGELRG